MSDNDDKSIPKGPIFQARASAGLSDGVTVVFQQPTDLSTGGYYYSLGELGGSGSANGGVYSGTVSAVLSGGSYTGYLASSGSPDTFFSGDVNFTDSATLVFGPIITVLEDG